MNYDVLVGSLIQKKKKRLNREYFHLVRASKFEGAYQRSKYMYIVECPKSPDIFSTVGSLVNLRSISHLKNVGKMNQFSVLVS